MPSDDDVPPNRGKERPPKVAILGASGVGKTVLARSLSGEDFEPTEATTAPRLWSLKTTGIAVESVLLDVAGEVKAELAGDVEEAELSAALVVLDARQPDELRSSARHWSELLGKKQNAAPFRKLLVAARTDIVADFAPGEWEDVARVNGYAAAFATSGKDRSGIEELRQGIREAARWHQEQSEPAEDGVAIAVRALVSRLCELIAMDPAALHRIEWRDLERVIAEALEAIGFAVELTPPAKDGGKDVVATSRVGKAEKTFYIEIKHWRQGKRPGVSEVTQFLEVNVRDGTDGGLFLSSSGYTDSVYSRVAQLTRQRLRLGQTEKIVHLCQQCVRKKQGVWRLDGPLPETLFAETIS